MKVPDKYDYNKTINIDGEEVVRYFRKINLELYEWKEDEWVKSGQIGMNTGLDMEEDEDIEEEILTIKITMEDLNAKN